MDPDPMAPMARGGLRRDLKTEALKKFPQQVSSPSSPVNAAVEVSLLERVQARLNTLGDKQKKSRNE